MFDIGVNITSSQFAADRDQVIQRARAAGVTGMLFTGTNLHESEQASVLALRYPACWATAGVHPHDSSGWQPGSEKTLYKLARQPQVVAIGECGLDFNRNYSTPAEQERAFTAQLALAAELNMPVFLHCRDAWPRFFSILDDVIHHLPASVIHCFTGDENHLRQCLARGLYIGVTGWVCDERRGQPLRALLPQIPAARLLLETDAPYLLPRDLRPRPASRRNEPCHLPHILRQVACWRGEDALTLERVTDQNVRDLLSIAYPLVE